MRLRRADDGDTGTSAANDEDAADPEVNSAVAESGIVSTTVSPPPPVPGAATRRRRRASAVPGTLARKALRASATRKKSAGERVARQRARILDAAERCFIQHGFHAASMADIAAAAGMSAGLIYRYFDGKNQIVQAIIEQHLETDGCPSMGNLNTSEDFCARAMEMFERWRRRDDPHMNAALMLELTAEAARDPEILRITRGKDETIMQMMTLAVQRAAAAEGVRLTTAAAQLRSVVLQCLVEGLACRAVRGPDLSVRQLKPLVAKVIAALMS